MNCTGSKLNNQSHINILKYLILSHVDSLTSHNNPIIHQRSHNLNIFYFILTSSMQNPVNEHNK